MELKTGYKQTEIGVIPSDWEVKEIGNEIDLLTGFPFPSSKYSIGGIRLLRGSNIKRGVTDWAEEITQYWEKVTPALKEYVLQERDVVIAMDGSLVGRSFAQVSAYDLPALLLQRVARVRSKKIDIGYLKEFICSEYFTKHCDAVKTSSAIPHISPLDIRKFKIPLPPTLAEQTAIATALSDTDQYITHLEKLIAKKRSIKQGAMQELLKPKEGWVLRKLGDVITVSSGISNTQSTGEKYPIFGSTGLIGWKDYFDYEGIKILVARVGANAGAVNKVYGRYCVSDNTLVLSIKPTNDVDFIFFNLILFQLNSLVFGSGQPLITGSQIKKLDIQFPRIEEQTRIATILSDMDAEISVLERKLEKARQVKQGMMQQLLTGKMRLA